MGSNRKRHVLFYKLVRPLVIVFLKITFGYSYKKAKKLPEHYIVISNHATDFDPLFVAASFPEQMYFVGSEHIARWKRIYKLLKYIFAPIMRPKGASAGATVIDIIKHVKRGANVCLFAEGVRTWDGVTCPIAPSTAKMVQRLGCGLVTYKIVGGYFASPMWGGASIRRGYIHGEPVNVYTKEQLKSMTVDEIYAAMTADLYEDAYARQLESPKKYRGKGLAEHMERLLFICPKCGKMDCFRSQGDTVSCEECGLTFRYTEYGMLEGAPFKTVKELSDWQKERICEDVANGVVYEAPMATLSTVKDHLEMPVTKGAMSISGDVLRCGEMEFALSDISDLAMHGQRAIVFTADKTYYELIPEQGTNALKFFLFYMECKNRLQTMAG